MKFKITFLIAFFIATFSIAEAQQTITLLDSLNYPGLSFAGAWHYVDSAGVEYGLFGASDGVKIVDISNPSNIFQVVAVPGQTSIWRELKVYGHYAYVSTESGSGTAGIDNGLQIIDLQYLPDSAPYKFWNDSVLGSKVLRIHSVTVADNGYLYMNGTHLSSSAQVGVVIASLTDPWNPVYAGEYTTNYVHDCIVYNDTMISSEVYAGQFAIVDMQNKSAPVVLNSQMTGGAFNHNSWRSDNGQTLFTTDEVSGKPLEAWDISDVSNIKYLDHYYASYLPSGEVHNVRVKNDYLICPSYGSKLTIVDAARPDNLIEVGWYPTASNLCWDGDPFLLSGNIIATDMGGFVYMLAPNYIRACYLEGNVLDSITNLPLTGVSVQVSIVALSESTNSSGDYKTGSVLAGTYSASFALPGYVTKTINNVVLTNGVLTTLDVQLVPVCLAFTTINASTCYSYTSPSGNYIWTATGTYTDTLTTVLGCDSVITVNLTINTSSSSQTVTACDIYTSPSGNYTWITSGTYTDTIPNVAGCDSVIKINLTINTIDNSVTQNGFILTANATSATYQWLDCNNGYAIINGETNQSFTPTVNGNYAASITANGCSDTSACFAVTGLGITEINVGNDAIVFPNPIQDVSEIVLSKSLESKTNLCINVYNSTGIKVSSIKQSGGKILIRKKDFSIGIYFFELLNDVDVFVKGSFVVE